MIVGVRIRVNMGTDGGGESGFFSGHDYSQNIIIEATEIEPS